MTVTEILTAARNRYNAVSDSFWSDDELIGLLYMACLDIARETKCVERVYSTSTVASQQEYDFPTATISIKRIQYNGKKLKQVTMREDDTITGLDQSTTDTGTPQYYFIWNETIYLRPLPDGIGTLKIWTYNEPQALTISSTLEVPTQFHYDLVDYMVSEMAAKDLNFTAAQFYQSKWEKAKMAAKRWQAKKARGDNYGTVTDEESSIENYFGVI
jgi:hypothetical protein